MTNYTKNSAVPNGFPVLEAQIPSTAPASPASEEVFVKPPLAAGFTLLGTTGAGVSLTDTKYGPLLVKDKTAGGNMTIAALNTAPGAVTFELIARMRNHDPRSGAGYSSCLMLRNSVSGKLIVFGNYNNEFSLLCQHFADFATYNSDIFNIGSNATPSMPWKRVHLAAGVLYFDISANGFTWVNIGSVPLATYIGSVDQVGFGVYSNGSAVQLYSWHLA